MTQNKITTKTIAYPADWPGPCYQFGQQVYQSQEPLTIVGMRLERYFSFRSDEDIQEWVYLVADREGEEHEVSDLEIGEHPVTVDRVMVSFGGDEESLP